MGWEEEGDEVRVVTSSHMGALSLEWYLAVIFNNLKGI